MGEGVTGFKIGDRVIAVTGHGGLVEKVAIPAASAYHLPEGRSFEDGAALLLTYATSIHALVDRGRLVEGETLLVLGAAGGVGLAAVELGVAFGARVIGAVSTEEKAAAVRAAGASDVVLYGSAPFDREQSKALADKFKAALGPKGADVIYDAVGGDYCEPALRSIAWEGRYLVVGFPAGIPKLPLNLTLLKSCDVCGVFWGAFARQECRSHRAPVSPMGRGQDRAEGHRNLSVRTRRRCHRASRQPKGDREGCRDARLTLSYDLHFPEATLSTFDDRERAFETKFARDEDMAFRVTARRNKLLGQWAAGLMGLTPEETAAYATSVVQADFEEAGDDDVVRKVLGDLTAAAVETDEAAIRTALADKTVEARRQLMESQ